MAATRTTSTRTPSTSTSTPVATRHAELATPLGPLTLVASGPALTGVYFPGHWTRPDAGSWGARLDDAAAAADGVLAQAAAELTAYLAGARDGFDVPTAASGSPLEERVWQLLREIPRGTTTTYGALAAGLGGPSMARMVGRAVGHNPLSIVVPCHRVVGATGALTGYAGGLERKAFLLDLEGWRPAQPALF